MVLTYWVIYSLLGVGLIGMPSMQPNVWYNNNG